MSKKIYVGSLPARAEAADVERFCAEFGPVESVEFKASGDLRYAEVSMTSGAEQAVKMLDGRTLGQTHVRVQLSISKLIHDT